MSRPRVETPRQLVPLPAALVDELARGYGGADAVRHLALSQQSQRRRLAAEVCALASATAENAESVEASGTAAPLLQTAAEAVQTLRRLDGDARCRAAVADVLGHPCLETWAELLLEPGGAVCRRPEEFPDLAHLAAIAGAAAIRAGADADVAVPVRHGAVHLPTLGRLVIAPHQRPQPGSSGQTNDAGHAPSIDESEQAGHADQPELPTAHTIPMVRLRIRGGSCSITAAPGWQAVRAIPLLGLAGGALAVEDTDPYRSTDDDDRDGHTGRIPREDWDTWRRTTADAWDLLRRDHARHASGIAAGLSTLIPLIGGASATPSPTTGLEPGPAAVGPAARTPFGAVRVALPRTGDPESDAASLALQVIHGFQRAKLGAVLALADLHEVEEQGEGDPAADRQRRALWQDTYALVAVADFWRFRFRIASGHDARDQARSEFVRCHDEVARVLAVLAEDRALTSLGRRFADALGDTLAGWTPEAR